MKKALLTVPVKSESGILLTELTVSAFEPNSVGRSIAIYVKNESFPMCWLNILNFQFVNRTGISPNIAVHIKTCNECGQKTVNDSKCITCQHHLTLGNTFSNNIERSLDWTKK